MNWTDDPVADAERYYSELEKQADELPVCDVCGLRIRANYAYSIAEIIICENCIDEFKVDTENL